MGGADLTGRARQTFFDWLGRETFGGTTFVVVTRVEEPEIEILLRLLVQHFVDMYGATALDEPGGVAREEIMPMVDLCDDHDPNALRTVSRELSDAGVREVYRTIQSQAAGIDQLAMHGSLDS